MMTERYLCNIKCLERQCRLYLSRCKMNCPDVLQGHLNVRKRLYWLHLNEDRYNFASRHEIYSEVYAIRYENSE